MDPQTVQMVNSILALASVLTPAALQLTTRLMQNVQGKSAAEIAALADAEWNDIKATAQAELSGLSKG